MLLLSIIENNQERSMVERLYQNNKSIMFHVAYKILHDKYLAEDAVQQAFIRIINNLKKIDENNCHKTRGFLVVICRNVAKDIYKSKTNLNKENIIDEIIDFTSDPVELIINRETINKVISEVKGLKPIYKDVMILKYSHGCTNEEISKLLNISSDAIRKRLERARMQLANSLRQEELV